MQARTADILTATVGEFIRTGESVSSSMLYERYNFGIRPAMIRLELNRLTNQNYLEQPHPSAGRIPGNKGYEFFARHTLDESTAAPAAQLKNLLAKHSWANIVSELSRELGAVGVLVEADSVTVHKDGLENLVDNLEWDSREQLRQVIHDFEELDNYIPRLHEIMQEAEEELQIFVGRKSPITRSEQLVVFAGECDTFSARTTLLAITPKRTDYRKAANIFKGLQSILWEL